jgi:molecular chaperone DnaK
VLDVGEGLFEVRSTAGDTHLGGDDYDQVLADHIAAEFKREQGIDLRQDRQALQRLKEAAEKAKVELSSVMETEINLPFITADANGPKHLQMKLSRAKLEQLSEGLTDRLRAPFGQALKDAGVSASEISEVVLVGGSTRMPIVQKLVQELTGKEPHKGVNPDEVVAIGAALQAGVLGGEVKDVLLLDVTPLSLGLETLGSVMTRLIERNTTVPVRKTEMFSTAADGQTAVDIHVLQGERPMATDNMTLGQFRLEGIPPAPRGTPQIEVAFDIDANGILSVSAKDMASGREQTIKITATTNLSDSDVERMVHEAQAHADEDGQRKELIEARNQGDSLAYTVEKTLAESGERVSPEDRHALERLVADLRDALKTDDASHIRQAMESLQQASYRLSEQMYSADNAGQNGGPAGDGDTGAPMEEEVFEGEFRQV